MTLENFHWTSIAKLADIYHLVSGTCCKRKVVAPINIQCRCCTNAGLNLKQRPLFEVEPIISFTPKTTINKAMVTTDKKVAPTWMTTPFTENLDMSYVRTN